MFGKKRRIYADAAAATPLAPQVEKRLVSLLTHYGNPGALHAEGVEAKRELDASRLEAAEAIGAHADEIVFTASGTEANNLALMGTVPVGEPRHVLSTAIEHPSILEPLEHLAEQGISVTYLPVDGEGLVDVQLLSKSLTSTTALVSIGFINSEIGVMQDVRAIAKVIRAEKKKRGEGGAPLYFHIDASQAPLWVKLKVESLGCDLMTLDAQKIAGPKGVGLLYVRRGVKLLPHIRGGGQEAGRRSGTENLPLIGAFARALVLAQTACEHNTQHVARLRDELFLQIKKIIPDAVSNGSMEHRVANNLNISLPGLLGERAVIALDAYGISASTRSSCASKNEDVSHVIMALGGGAERARTAIRFTLLPSISTNEVRKIVEALARASKMYRNIDMSAS